MLNTAMLRLVRMLSIMSILKGKDFVDMDFLL